MFTIRFMAPSAGALSLAEKALSEVERRPTEAAELAKQARQMAPDDREVETVTRRVAGLVARELNQLPEAHSLLTESVAIAEAASLPIRTAEARTSLALVLTLRGHTDQALAVMAQIPDPLPPGAALPVELQRSLILTRLGRYEEALIGYGRALAAALELGDGLRELRIRLNRSVVLVYQGDLDAARADLIRAVELAGQLGNVLQMAKAEHNLGFVAAMGGDLPEAMRLYDEAENSYRDAGAPLAALNADRCHLFLQAQLTQEAVEAAEAAVTELSEGGNVIDLAEARLMLARARLAQGDAAGASLVSKQAAVDLKAQGRPRWKLLADLLAFEADVLATVDLPKPPRSDFVNRANRLATRLVAAGWIADSLNARTIAARVALARKETHRAGQILDEAGEELGSAPVATRAERQLVTALTELARGNRPEAARAVKTGLRMVATHQASLGASELRARAGSLGEDLARVGLQMALDGGNPSKVLEWAEHWRAGSLRLPRVRPPDQPEIGSALNALRRLTTDLRQAALEGKDPTNLEREVAVQEERLRKLWRHLPGEIAGTPSFGTAAFDRDRLVASLHSTVLVEYVVLEGHVGAVVLLDGRSRLHRLGPIELFDSEISQFRFHLQRLIRPGTSDSSRHAALEGLEVAASTLGRALAEPLKLGDGRPVVVVPTGRLHSVAWPSIGIFRNVPVTVAPSATWWMVAQDYPTSPRHPGGEEVMLAAGPDLLAADEEVNALAGVYPEAQALGSSAATVAAVSAGMARARLAHVAAHGRFRRDNALFSSLLLTDGPLMVYDLESLSSVPDTIVLSACDAALNDVGRGDELTGLAAGLMMVGARSLIAPVVPIPDKQVVPFVLDLHRSLAVGESPAVALKSAMEASDELGPSMVGVARSFMCMGG